MNDASYTDDTSPLHHLVYISRAIRLFNNTELIELLKKARQRNKEQGLTGMLLYKDLSFIQVLEGSKSAVQEVFDAIQEDDRHWRIRVLLDEPLEARSFKQWHMGFYNAHTHDDAKIDGFTNYLQGTQNIQQLASQPTEALKLLQYFRIRS